MDTQTLPVIAIIGRPNVGKSTLFNRLAGKQAALVAPVAGVTRDTRTIDGHLGDLHFKLLDTAGIEIGEKGMAGDLNSIAEKAFRQADIILFMADGSVGLTPEDKNLAQWLRKEKEHIVCVINKLDIKETEDNLSEFYALGFGDPLAVSAEHDLGFGDLQERLSELLSEGNIQKTPVAEEKPIALAIVGRPNAGKSTLVNALLEEDRMLTGPLAGLTRESIGTLWRDGETVFELVDTPGMRKKSRVVEKLEQMSVGESLKAIDRAEVVVLVLDAACPYEHQDATLAAHVVKQGKPLLIVVNKWDRVAPDKRAPLLDELHFQLEKGLSQVKKIPLLPISALKNKGLSDITEQIKVLFDLWEKQIGTARLNRFLEELTAYNPPPIRKGRAVKIKFMNQTGIRPPTFTLWCNRPKEVPTSYRRFILNNLCRDFGFEGVVVRLVAKSGENPYNKKKSG